MREHLDDKLEYDKEEEIGIEVIDLYGRDKIVERTKDSEDTDDGRHKIDWLKEIASLAMSFVMAVIIATLMQRFVIINANIPSGSMENTIMTGDRLIGSRLSYLWDEPERGDIVIFRYPDDETQLFVKRVIGLPGENVVIENARVYINGKPLDEWYLKEEWIVDAGSYEFNVPEGSYFVMGDNRNNSKDSRYWINTYVREDQLLGKAVFRYWPFTNAGKLE